MNIELSNQKSFFFFDLACLIFLVSFKNKEAILDPFKKDLEDSFLENMPHQK